MFLAIPDSLPRLGQPAETLTLQQAQNFQQSKSSSPRSRMRKMSSGMSQRKLPGGHSASDSNVTPGHQSRCGVCREGAGRQGQRGTTGPQLSERWSSPVNLGNSSQRGMLFREGYHTSAHTQPYQRAVQHLAAIPAHSSRGKALIPKGLSESATLHTLQFT